LLEKDAEIRILSQKIKTMTDLFDIWKRDRYGHLQDKYDHLLAKQKWSPRTIPLKDTQSNPCPLSHSEDELRNIKEENQRLKEKIDDLQQQLQSVEKRARRKSSKLSLRIEKVSADRDQLHVQNLRLQHDLKQRDSKIREFTDILDQRNTSSRVSVSGVHVPFLSMTLRCDEEDVLCAEPSICEGHTFEIPRPPITPSFSDADFRFPVRVPM